MSDKEKDMLRTIVLGLRRVRVAAAKPVGRWTTLGRHVELGNKLFEEMKKQAGLK